MLIIKPQTKRALVFFGAMGAAYAAVCAPLFWAWGRMGEPGGQWFLALAAAPVATFSTWAAVGATRRLRLSLEGGGTEVIRVDVAALQRAAAEGRVSARACSRQRHFQAAVLGVAAACAAPFCIFAPSGSLWGPAAGVLGLIAAAAAIRRWLAPAPELAVADAAGITNGRKHIRWKDITRCEVRTYRHPLGVVTSCTCWVYTRGGFPEMMLNLSEATPESRRAFLDMVRGEPAGAELLSAEAPAGTGTELLAETGPAQPAEALLVPEAALAPEPSPAQPRSIGSKP